jgi:AcrR family transcriptional regulator
MPRPDLVPVRSQCGGATVGRAGSCTREWSLTRIDITAIRREQIIDAVRRIIVQEGLDAVTIARIAEEADVSRGVVTYHFDHKEQILHDVLRAAMRDANEASATFSVPRTARDLASMAERIAELSRSDNDWWRIYVAFLANAQTSDFYRSELAWVNRHYAQALGQVVDTPGRALTLLALMQGLAIQRMLDPEPPIEEVVSEIASLLEGWQSALEPSRVAADTTS